MRELKPFSFIYEIPQALPDEICHDMIRRFEAAIDSADPARARPPEEAGSEIRKPAELRISGLADWKDIDAVLMQSLTKHFSVLAQDRSFFTANRFKDLGYSLRRCRAGETCQDHTDPGPAEAMTRQLAALWYLNEVPGPGGENEFPDQGLQVRPEQGKLLLFPPFWTHPQHCTPLEQGAKYIASTWICFA